MALNPVHEVSLCCQFYMASLAALACFLWYISSYVSTCLGEVAKSFLFGTCHLRDEGLSGSAKDCLEVTIAC